MSIRTADIGEPWNVERRVHLNLVFLPGLDGTGDLFDRLARRAPLPGSLYFMSLPPDRVLSYDELVQWLLPDLPHGPTVLIGESFSGPLALRLARHVRPVALVLCASIVRAPMPMSLLRAPLSLLLRITPPRSLVNALLTGGDSDLAADVERAIEIVDKRVLASRLRMALDVDATGDLAGLSGRVLYLRATRDRLIGAGQAELVHRVRPDARVATVDGPHLLLQARPLECWRIMAPFISAALRS